MKDNSKEVDKHKLIRLIAQGEGKNTKHILSMPEVEDGLREILGDEQGRELVQVLKRIVTAADKLDWTAPFDERGMIMSSDTSGGGFGGAVDIEWE